MVDRPGVRALAVAHLDHVISRGLDEIAAKCSDDEGFGAALNAYHAGLIDQLPVWAAPRVTDLCRAAVAARLAVPIGGAPNG